MNTYSHLVMKMVQGLIIGCFTGLLVACSNSQALLTYAPSSVSTPLAVNTASITPTSTATKIPPTNSPSPAPTSTPLPTNTPSPTHTPFPIVAFSGSPNVEKALRALYPQDGVAIYNDKVFGMDGTFVEVPVDSAFPEVYKVILAEPFTENHSQKYAIFAGDITLFSLCHSCFSPISGTIFIKKDNDWSIETRNDYLGEIGEWGIPPQGKLVKIGRDKYGFLFLDTFNQQGASITSLTLFSNINGQLKWILGVPEIAWKQIDFTGETEKKLWDYSSTVKFIPGDNTDYFDLLLTTTGTKPNQDFTQVEIVNEKKTYIFNGSEYVLP